MANRELTNKQKQFVKEYVVDWNATKAALRAGYCANSVKQMGSKLLTKVDIKREVKLLQTNLAKKIGFTIEQAQQMYKEDRDFARQCNQSGAAVTATTGICRLYGMDKDANIGEKTVIIISPKAPVRAIDSVTVHKEPTNGQEEAL